MCHFVTLIAPTDDAAAVRAIMDRHGRGAGPIDNPSIRKVLRDGDHQYLTTRGHCDCGTILSPRHPSPEAFEDELAKEGSRLKRKGWSQAKIARAIEDRRRADARPRGGGPDSIELWSALLIDLKEELKLPYVGLLVRAYSGAIETEVFAAKRRELPRGAGHDALTSLREDEVTIFGLT
jgi:hypothetical protein